MNKKPLIAAGALLGMGLGVLLWNSFGVVFMILGALLIPSVDKQHSNNI